MFLSISLRVGKDGDERIWGMLVHVQIVKTKGVSNMQ
jgi:hypothetical protein